MGNHVICSLFGVAFGKLDDLEAISQVFDLATDVIGATVLNRFSHRFLPQGVTIVYALAESHISCHTFPEKGSVALDCYTCGSMDAKTGMQTLIDYFSPETVDWKEFSR